MHYNLCKLNPWQARRLPPEGVWVARFPRIHADPSTVTDSTHPCLSPSDAKAPHGAAPAGERA